MKLHTLLFLSILILFTSCTGQNSAQVDNHVPAITKGETVKELADSILVIFQDRNTIYWFGSNGKGVYRYDGKSIAHFTGNDGLCGNKIEQILEDKSGNIFFNTPAGISKFDGQSFSTLSIAKSYPAGEGWKREPDDLWFKGAQDSGVVYRYDGQLLHRLQFPKTKAGEEHLSKFPRSQFPAMKFNPYDVYTIYRDSKGSIWFGTNIQGICRYDGKSFSWMYEKHLTDIEGGGSFGIRSILEDKKGKFWFCNTRYRYTIAPEGRDDLITYTKEKGIDKDDLIYYMSITEDAKGVVWMVTYGDGVWRYDPGEEKLTHYPIKDGDKTVTLFSIYKDRQGDLWLGTHNDGAYKFNGKTFEKFRL